MLRIFLSFIGAFFLSLGIFWILQLMIQMNVEPTLEKENMKYIDFVRLKKEQLILKKERLKPKKPKRLERPKTKVSVKQKNAPTKQNRVQAMPLNIELPRNLFAKGILGDALVSEFGGMVNSNVIPLSQVDPIYPSRAKRLKIEGKVEVEFTITAFGGVKDIVIIDSNPKGTFDTAVKRSIIKWKFKPKMDKQKAVPQRATLTFTFRLEK